MTFSLTARCPGTGALGIAISSSSPAVAARCTHLRPGVGASASQNITDPRLGERLLDRLADGDTAAAAMTAVVAADPTADYRQLTVVDTAGRVAGHSGRHTLGIHHLAVGAGAVADATCSLPATLSTSCSPHSTMIRPTLSPPGCCAP